MDSSKFSDGSEVPSVDVESWDEEWESIPRTADRGDAPLSYEQQRLWFLDQLEPGRATYNVPVALRLRGALDVPALEASLAGVIARHDILRSRIGTAAHEQRLVPADIPFHVQPVDFTSADSEGDARERAEEEARRPFDLSTGPLFRATLVKVTEHDHLLVLVFHHIVVDGWSIGVFCNELRAFYAAGIEGTTAALPDLPIQFGDYAAWQRSTLEGNGLDRLLSYWTRQLAGSEPLEFPTDRPRPSRQTFNGACESFQLSTSLTSALRDLSCREGATMFMTLVAAFNVLLARYTGKRDISVGSPVANRGHAEVEGLIGFFVNMLVLRTDVSGDPTFRQLLTRVRKVCLDGYAHQELPFHKLVEALQPERDLSRPPLCQVLLSLQNASSSFELPGLDVESIDVSTGTSKVDLNVTLEESEGRLFGTLEYNPDLFDRTTVQRIVAHYKTLLDAIAANPEQRVSDLELLTTSEQLQIAGWNDTARTFPQRSIVELFEAQVAQTPTATAIISGRDRVSYAALNSRANQVAHYLRRIGIGAEARVGIAMERSVEMIVALVGVLKAGGAYVPLDPSYPAERLQYMAVDAQIDVLLTLGVRPADVRVIHLDRDWPEIVTCPVTNPGVEIAPEQLAYVIYTSGSTGWPKGAMVTHGGLANYLQWAAEHYAVADGNGSAVHSSLSFDLTVTSLYLPLIAGRTVTLVAADADVDRLAQVLRDSDNLSLLKLTPAHLEILEQRLTDVDLSGHVRGLVIGGEALRGSALKFWREHARGTRLINEYGPTETVVGCCVYDAAEDDDLGAVPIGRPIANLQMHLLDADLAQVPVGVAGDIYIGGAGVARGYQGRPDLTADRFVPDPFATLSGARLYRTGDRARYRADGAIEYLGRADDQVKIRGYRVELGEIEATLEAHPDVAQAAVTLRRTASGDARLLAYVARAEPSTLVLSGVDERALTTGASVGAYTQGFDVELREFLEERLPEYEIPSAIVVLDALPLTVNGKVDRKALPDIETRGDADKYQAPRTAVESLLGEIWAQAEVLGVENLGVHDNFFDLGGHSLLATRVMSRVRETFDVEMPLRSLFEAPTVAEMAKRVEQALGSDAVRPVEPIVRVPRTGPLPVSYAQQRLWFLDQLDPGSASYNVPIVLALTGTLNAAALEASLMALVARHEALRTHFVLSGDELLQRIEDEIDFSLRTIDFTGREADARQWAEAEARRAFDLGSGPLFRASLLTLGESEHWLVLVLHHIVIDGWAVGVLLEELAALYRTACGQPADALPALQVQYADYAAWQRRSMSGDVDARQLAYWTQQLSGLEALELPADRPRPAVQSQRGATEPFELSTPLTEALYRLSRREGVTLFMTLLAAWDVLLARYTGRTDIAVGSPVANRNRTEIEGLIGFFVNTLVFRTDLAGDPSVRDLLARVRKVCLDGYAHQDLPFEKLVEELQPERDLSRSPVFQVLFALQNAPGSGITLPGLENRFVAIDTATAKFDLNVSLQESGRALTGTIEYSTDLFDRSTIQRLILHYTTLLEAAAADPEQRISELPLLTASERRDIARWNETAREFSGRSIVELFEVQAANNPTAVAVECGDERMTYGELNARANRLAYYLGELGVVPETRVGICLGRSFEMVVALFGVLKAGGAYVPLDPNYPIERLQYMASDANVEILLTEWSARQDFGGSVKGEVCLDVDWDGIAERPATNPNVAVAPESLAYVIYTSGSTGWPKGVMISHHGLSNYLHWASDAYRAAGGAGSAVHSSLSFDLTVTSLFVPLVAGRTVRLLATSSPGSPGSPVSDVEDLARVLREADSLSLLKLTPAHLEVLEHQLAGVDLTGHVNALVVGGEALHGTALEFWRARAAGTRLINEYGPTETVVGCCVYEEAAGDRNLGPVLIGRPIANLQMHILDANLERVPVGVPGEIFIGGDGVGRGYLGRPDLTAERFVPDPFGASRGGRLYKTGDRARYRAGGDIEYLGRLDDQVKIRGYRVELGEVEAVIAAHPAIDQVAVTVRQQTSGDARLVAYVTRTRLDSLVVEANPHACPERSSFDAAQDERRRACPYAHELETALRAYLKERLPEYEIPSAFVVLEQLPLTVNGKIDRAALPEPDAPRGAEDARIAPRTPLEAQLAEIWTEVLGAAELGVHDNFFELGGHSLLATRVISRVRRRFDVDIPLRSLFEAPTVAAMAARIEAARHAEAPAASSIGRMPRTGPLPVSYAQQRLWFLDQLEPGSASYNVPLALKLEGDLDVVALEMSLADLIGRHEVLRTRFVVVDEEPLQQIDELVEFGLGQIDFSGEDDPAAAAQHWANCEAKRPFDLSTGPLIRATLLHVAREEHWLVLVLHHIAIDGWSLEIVVKDLAAYYNAYRNRRSCSLPELPVQYADYAAWQRQWLDDEVRDRQLEYWKKQLADLEPIELPADRSLPPVQTFNGATEPFELPPALSTALRTLSRHEGATLFMTLVAAWQALLARYTGRRDIAVGTPVANRSRAEIEGLIGFFVNTLVLRTSLEGDPSFRDLLARVRKTAIDAYAHQDLPFEKLVEELQPERDLARSPLFQVMFALQDTSTSSLDLVDLESSYLPLHNDTAKFQLNVNLADDGSRVSGLLEYNTDLFDRATIQRLVGHYLTLLDGVAVAPERRLSELPLLSASERGQIARWNDTARACGDAASIVELFESQAAQSPTAAAVVSGSKTITYAELNERANQLAHYLRALGVGAETRVGLSVERSIDMVVALLGVLKAGGAYVPLDPSYPAERLQYMAEDGQIEVLLTGSDRWACPERSSFDAAQDERRRIGSAVAHVRVVHLDRDWPEIAWQPATNPSMTIVPEQVAYLIYTSGSTGLPKGAMVTHRGLANYLQWASAYYEVADGGGSAVHSSLSFDLTVTSLYLPLIAGRTVTLVAAGADVDELARVLRDSDGLSLLKLTPAHLEVLEQRLADCDLTGRAHALVIGGESLHGSALTFWREHAPGTRLINEYGPTETVVGCCVYDAAEDDALDAVPIDRPIANLQMHLLDADLAQVPVGVAAEIFIGGAGVARGYHARPDLTAERFVPDPFARTEGARLYRTGDRARYRADGTIDYLGRRDDQVKIRGYRVELGEIEATLATHPDVAQAAVVVQHGQGGPRLVAYVTPTSGALPDAASLRAFLSRTLPEYEVPAAYAVLDELPLTVNGKVDRKALPDVETRGDADTYQAPRTAVENLLGEIWAQAEVLGVENLGVHDNFFELGGHSLLATRVMSRVRQTFDVEMPLRSLFEAPTIAAMAERVESALHSNSRAADPIAPAARTRPLPVSYAQQRLWFLDRLEPGNPSYNVPFVLSLSGALDAAALEASLTELIRRHEVLRTRFITIGDEPYQQIDADVAFSLERVDCGSEDEARRWAEREARRPFDLSSGPLFRAALLKVGEHEHWLMLVMHHIVIDGWAVGVLLNELAALYRAGCNGEPCRLAPLPVQYADYAVWQRQWMNGEVYQRQLAYWTEQLAGVETPEVPTDRPRPPVQTQNGATEEFALTAELSQALQRLSRREGVTLFMTLVAAWDALVARYTGRTDIVVGSPVANRNRAEIEGLIGFFVNTLVLRVDLGGDPSFRQLLTRVRKVCLDAYAHQDLPFESLVEALQPERDLSRPPLFQVLFALQNAHDAGVDLQGVSGRFVPIGTSTSKFDLNVSLHEQAGRLFGTLEYNTDLFDRTTIQRILAHYTTLLEAVAADPEQRVSDLPLLTAAERHQLCRWNETERAFPSLSVVQLFERQAAEAPLAPAVVFGNEVLTFTNLNDRVNRLAHYLRVLGVTAETRVGICLERSFEMVVALVGVLKAGGAYVPLDPSYPSERLEYMTADSGLDILLTQAGTRNRVAASREICLDDVEVVDAMAKAPADNPVHEIVPDELAYLIYTSGSTGWPKAAMVTHGGLSNYLQWAADAYRAADGCGSAVHSSLSFDLTVTSLFVPLVAGRPVRLVATTTAGADVDALANELREGDGLSLLKLTPAHLQVLEQRLGDVDLSGRVRGLVIGGEALHGSTLKFWREHAPGTRLINEYGPTETVVGCCVYDAAHDDDLGPVPIGGPIANLQMHLLDANLTQVPVGVPGEIYIGGAGVGRGYLGRPDLTAERFVPDPFGPFRGARLYRTGDRARYRTDGTIEYLGRFDDQVKIRGYRVELGEIEAALAAHSSVARAAVVVRQQPAGDRRLVAYVTAKAGAAAPDAATLRAYLSAKLPEYEVPSAYAVLDTLPLTVNGKVDRKALPDIDARGDAETYQAPRTAVESLLGEIWAQAEVLGVENLGIHDNFFEMGGHSLLATRVISRVRQTFDVEMPLRSVFEAPTVAEMAKRVEQALSGDAARPANPIVRVPRTTPLPVSYAQQRLWFLDQLEPGSASYNVPLGLRLSGELNVDALDASLRDLANRHEVLRTRFVTVDSEPRQLIDEHANVDVRHVDVSASIDPEREAQQIAEDEVARPFDLTTGPLLRATCVRIADTEHLLVFAMHHIVLDGWSVGILLNEFIALYESHRSQTPHLLPELPVQYADYAVWQRQWLADEVHDRQLAYWKGQLKGVEVLELPTDRPRPAVQTLHGATVPFELPASLTGALQQLSRREGVTLFMTLLAGFNVLLSRYTGRLDLAVGSPVANRNRAEIEGLIGFFVNTLVLRSDLHGDPTFRDTLARVRRICLDAYAHQDLPFEKLVEELQPERDLSRSPLFQVMFSLNDTSESDVQVPGLRTSFVPLHTGTSKFDLNLHLSERSGHIAGVLEYNTDLFEPQTIQRVLTHYVTVLEAVAAEPEQRLSAVPLLTAAERQQIIGWNETVRELAPLTIVDLFERQVEQSPHAIAIATGDERVSFADLNRRANRLARHLSELGADAETRVGICVERSIEMVVALLGVLKAGAAYVPLDPAYPLERLDYMAADAGIAIVLTAWSTRQQIRALGAAFDTAQDEHRRVGPEPREVCLDVEWADIAQHDDTNLDVAIDGDNLAYVIYTSGSTGKPKGAMVHHRGLSNYLQWAADAYEAAGGDGSAVHSSLSFDLTITSLYLPLVTGCPVTLLDPRADVDELANVVRHARGLSLLKLTPAHLEVLEQRLAEDDLAGNVNALVIGGEALHHARLQFWRDKAPGTRLINEYGPTETVVGCCVHDATDVVDPTAEGAVSIGKPIANLQMHILDGNLERVPVGVPGEVFIGGAGVARGYIGRPDLTAERFLPNPFAAEKGARLYKTGDRARYRADGRIDYLGRLDDQVKIRGYRVELGEIEAALTEHPAVTHAAVALRRAALGDARLIAYVVGADPRAWPDTRGFEIELREFLKERLPEYEIPSAFVVLGALPLTVNGKVDRTALPEPDPLKGDSTAAQAPRTASEGLLHDIWTEVLGTTAIGIHDNFFELGGHSLLATRVISRVRQIFEIELPLRSLFEAPTIAGMAARVEAARRGESEKPDRPMRASRDAQLPLSYAQQRLWFLHQLDPQSAVYNIPLALRLTGELDEEALGRAVSRLVERHEVLRTRFVASDDEPMQVIDPSGDVDLRRLDFSGSEDDAQRWAQQEARAPFDLSRGPLVRVSLLRLGANEHVLLFVMHHSVVDGWSVGIVLEELGRLYDDCRSGETSPLPGLPVQYADYAIWQRRWLDGAIHERQVSYWTQQLQGLEVLELTPDRPRPSVQTFNGACETLELPASIGQALHRVSRDEGATMFMTLLAAFQLLLARYTGRKDVAVGTTVANRTQLEVEGLVGFFVNTLVMRTNLDGNPSFREVVRRVRKTCLDAYAHQDLPFEKLVEELHPERDLSRSPFFTILFQLQNAPESPLAMSGLETETYPLGTNTAKFDLHLALSETAGQLAGSIEYNTDLFEPETVRRLLNHYATLLEGVAADPEQPVSMLPLLTAGELAQLGAWNDTTRAYRRDESLVSLFEERVDRSPDAVAVISGEREWTFTELNARANQLASYLVELGVGCESRIGICLERSAEMMMALLAVLKTGASYVPLDPEYPSSRLDYMIGDAGIEILLTRSEFQRGPGEGRREVLLDVEWDQLSRRDGANPGVGIESDQVAYVLYTSGSTGRPKGVMGTHRATINRLAWMYDAYPFEPHEVCCAKASLNFVDSIWELFGPLLKGVPTVLLPAALNYDLEAFVRTLARFRVTRLVLVPSLLRAMLETTDGEIGLPDLKYWVTSGEPLPASLAHEFLKRVPDARLLNLYGSSEDAADVTCHELRSEVTTVSAPIGRPIANTEIHILDRDLNPVPIGVPGEICVAGDGLARGYLNRPDLTAEKFVPNPFAAGRASRMYRTGDLGAFQPDGTVAFLGRTDHQVKIRGHRVEIGEVEAALESHSCVKQAIVTAIDDGAAGKMLAAYFVAHGEAPAPEELRGFLRNALPAYMVPSFFIEMGEMPLMPNAKVDRRALPAPARRASDEDRVQAPLTDLEERIGAIWKQLLNIDHVGLDDNFFDVGGHSLQIVRLRSEMRKAFGRELTVLDLFSHPTIRSLAGLLGNGSAHREAFSIANIHHRANLRREFFSRIQQEVERRFEA